jgi:hypothetical protein
MSTVTSTARLTRTSRPTGTAGVTSAARFTGLAYLGLAISGLLGFMLVRQQLYVPGEAVTTAANLVAHESLARLGIALDLTGVVAQALAALGFFRLFRGVHQVAAASIAAFGLVNAVVILLGTAFSATALGVAVSGAGTVADRAADAQLLYDLNGAVWDVGGIFFGLWLIPMGWLVLRSGSMPRLLGWLLVIGGVGYVLGTYLGLLAPGAASLSDVLTVPATAGELWMVGYLLVAAARQTLRLP